MSERSELPLCPKCNSKSLQVERRPNGDAQCLVCVWKGPYAECFKPAPSAVEAKGEYCEWCKSDLRHHDGCPDKPNPEPSAREWKLRPIKDASGLRIALVVGDSNFNDMTHVIEHTAYQKLERELAEKTRMLSWSEEYGLEKKRLYDEMFPALTKEREKVAGLCDALTKIDGQSGVAAFSGRIAREALKRFGDGK